MVTFNNEDLEERSGHSGFDQFACYRPIIVAPQFVSKESRKILRVGLQVLYVGEGSAAINLAQDWPLSRVS